MTTEQAVNRQADHENLIQELVNLLEIARENPSVRYRLGDSWVEDVEDVFRKVKS